MCLINRHWIKSSVLPWVILIFAAMNIVCLGGKRRAFGSFIAILHKEFGNITLTELNWVGDSYAALGFLTSSLSIAVIIHFNRRYELFQFLGALFILASCLTSSFVPNPHWLFLTHTLLHGIGSSLVISVIGLIVGEYFDKNHPYHLLATTLICGGSLAAILFVSFFAYIIQLYTWRTAFIILGVLYFVIIGTAAIFFKKNEEIEEVENELLKFTCHEIRGYQIPLLLLWFLDRFITSTVTYGLLLNLTDYLYRIHPDLVQSSLLTIFFAAGEALSYVTTAVVTGVTKDFFKNRLRYVLLITSIIASVALMTMEFTSHIKIARSILCLLTGYSMGFSNTLFFPAGEELTLLPGHVAYPFSLAGMGCGLMASPILTAKIAEIFTYKWFFLVQGCLTFIKVMCILIIMLLLCLYKRYELLEEEQDEDLLQKEKSGERMKLLSHRHHHHH